MTIKLFAAAALATGLVASAAAAQDWYGYDDGYYYDDYGYTAYDTYGYADPYAGYGYVDPYGGMGYDPYAAHAENMQFIHDYGSQILANGAANSAMMDANHEAFMETLRN